MSMQVPCSQSNPGQIMVLLITDPFFQEALKRFIRMFNQAGKEAYPGSAAKCPAEFRINYFQLIRFFLIAFPKDSSALWASWTRKTAK
jgi:TusA-related sulfurtransferase